MEYDVRPPAEDELRLAMETTEGAFGSELVEADWERERIALPVERALAAFDGPHVVGFTGAYEFDLTIPGGQVPCGGVTWVGVPPTHRRRGILRSLMERQLRDIHEWGEPVAALWASEASIYGRFGYGVAAPGASIEGDCGRFELRDDPGSDGEWRLVTKDEAYELFLPVHEQIRKERPGFITRSEHWWKEHRLADPENWRRGASRKFYAVFEFDGAVEAYALYRIKDEWEHGFPRGTVRVLEAFATTSEAERELWRFLFGIDLTTQVEVFHFDPASPLFLMAVDPRSLHMRIGDGLWLRLVDVEAALDARSYREGEPVVLEVWDDLLEWNEGRYVVGDGAVERTKAEPDLALGVADLASVYLGAFDFERLVRAERASELTDGAAERASDLFRTPLPPFCPEVF